MNEITENVVELGALMLSWKARAEAAEAELASVRGSLEDIWAAIDRLPPHQRAAVIGALRQGEPTS